MINSASIELKAYLQRIGYAGPLDLSISTLNGLVAAHVAAIPFENVGVLLGYPIRLDSQSLQSKLVGARRGGYCFEHNGLMLLVLTALGFRVRPIAARVRIKASRDEVPPLTHLFLAVDLDGEEWLVDVGVGGLSLTSAVRHQYGFEQSTPHEPRRLVCEDGRRFHQVRLGDVWSDVCEFTLDDTHAIDWEVANWWTSTSPNSKFKNRLMVARAGLSGERYTINNKQFTVRQANGQTHSESIHSCGQLESILKDHFSLSYPSDPMLEIPGEPW